MPVVAAKFVSYNSGFNNIVYITSMLKVSCRRSISGLCAGIHYNLYHFYIGVRD